MATETSSIDDVLATAHLPVPPESQVMEDLGTEDEAPSMESEVESQDGVQESSVHHEAQDEYGNEVASSESRMYTEEEVNERINKAVRERLSRLQKNETLTSDQAQHAQQNFEYDPSAEGDWKQQLRQFIKQTYQETIREEQTQAQQLREQQAQVEFEEKFSRSMGRFKDFREVVASQPITDAMTMATRSMSDPAAFLYAASKRHPEELQRISRLTDPYAQMVEIGRLEERMKKSKSTTNAPRPISPTNADGALSTHRDEREPSIEELIAQADARKLKRLRIGRR